MSIAERLRALHEPEPDIDLDRALTAVRRRARKRRQVRAALVSGVAVTLAVVAGASLLAQDGEGESQVDTVDRTETADRLDALVELLLDDDAVLGVVPDLVPKTDYSTGETYGQITEEELVGPTGGAISGVVRQWSQDFATAAVGEPYTVISTVVEFPTARAAAEAAAATLALLPDTAADLGTASFPAKMTATEPDNDIADGFGVTTKGRFLVGVQVGFVGEGDPSVLIDLIAAAAARVMPTDPPPLGSGDYDPVAQAEEMARRLRCESTSDGTAYLDPVGPPPDTALFCQIGDAQLNITVYPSQGDVADALAAADASCGHRAVGSNWIVVVNTPESARSAAVALSGEPLALSGCEDN